jgi:sugar O-acyltransferase (sialic acid O-acetyltransferase NeuD family)
MAASASDRTGGAAMTDLVIFGVGKVADVLYRYITFDRSHTIVGFTCDAEHLPADRRFHGLPVVPFATVEARFPPASCAMLIAVGYHRLNALRAAKFDEAKAKGYRLASYVSSRAFVGDWLAMGENCIILDNVGIEPGARLGDNVALWSNVTIGHHAVIGDHCWLAAHGIVGGNAALGPRCFLGLNVTIGHQTTIGADSFLGAGVVVTKSAADNSVFIGRDTELFRLDSKKFLQISKML